MNKKTALLLVAALLVSLAVAIGLSAASLQRVPSLFHNDEAWYKDEIAPALYKDGRYYIPSDLLAMFDYISFTTLRDGENLLLVNGETGDYVSILYSRRAACVNGKILEDVNIFRENGFYYLDAEFVCLHLGLFVEYSEESEFAKRSVRIFDTKRIMGFAELLEAYAREQAETEGSDDTPGELFPGLTEEDPRDGQTRIFLVCKDMVGDGKVLAWSFAQRLGYEYSLFLTPDSTDLSGVNMNRAVGLAVSDAEEAETLNDRLETLYCRKTHLVLSTGSDAEDKKLSRAGYFILKPDFTVDQTTDAAVLLRKIEALGANRDYITVLLGNVWQSETLLMGFNELDEGQFTVVPIK